MNTARHFGQMIGSVLRSKNFASQLLQRRLVPSSGFLTVECPFVGRTMEKLGIDPLQTPRPPARVALFGDDALIASGRSGWRDHRRPTTADRRQGNTGIDAGRRTYHALGFRKLLAQAAGRFAGASRGRRSAADAGRDSRVDPTAAPRAALRDARTSPALSAP
jgi:hypothetical protein